MDSSPDLVVVWGARSVLSLVGIVVLVAGVWKADRTWDEEGSKAYERAAATGGEPSGEGSSLLTSVTIPQEELDAAFPFPWMFLLGWLLYAVSYLFAAEGGYALDVTAWGVLALVFSLSIGVIASVPMGEAVKNRNGSKKAKLGLMFVGGWLLLTVATISSNPEVSFLFCPFGAICIIASMKILWKHRKMGDSWEQEGRPNPNPVVYNLGGPLFVFGWFLFWLGATSATGDTMEHASSGVYLPLYFTGRSLLAFIAGCGMVPVVLMADYAHDEGAEYVGFGTDGRFFGRCAETPIPFLSAWTLFGVASLFPVSDGISLRQWIILVNCLLQGVVAGILIQTALYKGDIAGKTKWSIPFVLLFLLLALNIGLNGGVALALALPGAFLIILGQKTVFGDRKRGDYWMETQHVNPNPVVYSYGEPFFMTGWILMSLAMSIPM